MSAETAQRILQFIQQTFPRRLTPGRALEPSTPLFSSQVIDSMGLVELLVFVERELGVSLDATIEELTTLDTAANLASHIDRLQRDA